MRSKLFLIAVFGLLQTAFGAAAEILDRGDAIRSDARPATATAAPARLGRPIAIVSQTPPQAVEATVPALRARVDPMASCSPFPPTILKLASAIT